MLPVSTREPDRFVPPNAGEGECYLIRVPSLFDRAKHRADLVEYGVDYPGEAALAEAMKAGVAALEPENAAALIEEIEDFFARPLDERQADPVATERMAAIGDLVADVAPQLRRLAAKRMHYLSVAPLMAAARFLVGIEGRPEIKLKRQGGLLREDVLEAIGPELVELIGWRTLALMHLNEGARKNSAAPSPSDSTPSPSSTAQPEKLTVGRPTADRAG